LVVPRLQSKVQRCITIKARLHKMPEQTHRQDRLQYTAPQLASV